MRMANETDKQVQVTSPESIDDVQAPRSRPEVTEGVKIRAVIDADVVKGLQIINGGGAVALLAFLPVVIGKPQLRPLANAVLISLLIFAAGLVFAVVHNRLRRVCSNIYDNYDYRPPPGQFWKFNFKEPTPCAMSKLFMWASLGAFIASVVVVFVGGWCSLNGY
jgi:hypothetical protein